VIWLETIKVQAADGQESAIENELTELAPDVRKNPDCPGLVEAALYSHASVPGYFAIRLFWDTDCPQIRGSLLGLSLTQTLKAFGLVDHSVWIETRRLSKNTKLDFLNTIYSINYLN